MNNYSKVFDLYWEFAKKRQDIFFKRFYHEQPPFTDDNILLNYKFTNAYRASDRVSQYLIKNVIYKDDFDVEDTLFRILLFKIFNKIETWEFLNQEFGEISYKKFDINKYATILNERIKTTSIYSSAYIMPSALYFNHSKKHENHLELIKLIMKGLPIKIEKINSLSGLYEELVNYPTLGPFLAFQYSIDINYSDIVDFDEMSFVVVGPGARRGIQKCFGNVSKQKEIEIIEYCANNQEKEFEKRGLEFKNLFGRRLQLIDCQNLFCEIDKYARVACPEIKAKSGKRIKNKFKQNTKSIEFFYPPKWKLEIDK